MTIRSENLVAQIEQNKPTLQALFDIPAESTINLLNLLKHESGLEATTLNPAKSTQATRMVDLDYNNLSNMRAAWTHIYNAPRTTIIDNYAIRDIHHMLCQNTDNKKYMQYLRNSADGDKDSYYEYMLEKMLFTQRALLGVMAKYNLGQTK